MFFAPSILTTVQSAMCKISFNRRWPCPPVRRSLPAAGRPASTLKLLADSGNAPCWYRCESGRRLFPRSAFASTPSVVLVSDRIARHPTLSTASPTALRGQTPAACWIAALRGTVLPPPIIRRPPFPAPRTGRVLLRNRFAVLRFACLTVLNSLAGILSEQTPGFALIAD